MKTLNAKNDRDIILGAHIGLARVGPRRRPVLRYLALDPTTGELISADLAEPPAEVDALVEYFGGLDDPAFAGRDVFLTAHRCWQADARRELREFRAALRRWRSEERAAGRLCDPPRFADETRGPVLEHAPWLTYPDLAAGANC